MIVVMLPFFFTAMYEKDGMPAEKIAKKYLRAKIWPARRVYKTQNLYDYIEKEGKSVVYHNALHPKKNDSTKAKEPPKKVERKKIPEKDR
jgi:hypothetical protein